MKKRDETLDLLRGFAMLWVIVVHVFYWGNFFSNGHINLVKSFCLFEMPLFFFVTGAGNSFGKSEGYFGFVFRRYQRMLIPYWVFAVICAGLSIVFVGISGEIDFLAAINILISWLIPVNRQITSIPYLTWALWFVPVYLIVVLLIPFMKRMKSSKYAVVFLFLFAALFAIACFVRISAIQQITFYSLWTYIGLFYKEIRQQLTVRRFRRSLGQTALIGTAALLIFFVMGQPIDMQYNKFPPNMMFGVYSAVMMSLILLIIPHISKLSPYIEKCKTVKKMIDLYSKRSMTIFLYQVFAFNLTILIANMLVPGSGILTEVIKSILCFVATVPVCAVLALIFGGIENISIKWPGNK